MISVKSFSVCMLLTGPEVRRQFPDDYRDQVLHFLFFNVLYFSTVVHTMLSLFLFDKHYFYVIFNYYVVSIM